MRAARDLGACCVAPDTSLGADENVELLLRALRLLQLGLEVQVSDNDGLLQETNALREDVKVCVGLAARWPLAWGAAACGWRGLKRPARQGHRVPQLLRVCWHTGAPRPTTGGRAEAILRTSSRPRLAHLRHPPHTRTLRSQITRWRMRSLSCGSCGTRRRMWGMRVRCSGSSR